MMIKLTFRLFVSLISLVGALLLIAPQFVEGGIFACRVEETPSSMVQEHLRHRGWYLVDARRRLAARESLPSFPYAFMVLSPDFSFGVTEAIVDDTIQPELFLHRNGAPFRRNYPVTNAAGKERFIDWSPDSRKLLFNRLDRRDNSDTGLYTIDVNTGQEQRLTDRMALEAMWSPDGQSVFYYTSFNKGYFVVDLELGEARHVGDHMGALYDWSPDNRYVLIRGEKRRTGIQHAHFVLMDVQTGQHTPLDVAPIPGVIARWTDDPDQILYIDTAGGVNMLHVPTLRTHRVDNDIACADIVWWHRQDMTITCNTYVELPGDRTFCRS